MEYKLFDFDPRNLPAEYLQKIGLIITCSTQTENLVEGAIGGMLSLRVVPAKILTTHMSMQVRLGVLRTAAERLWTDKAMLSQFDAILQRIEAAVNERNRIAHITWQRDPETGEVFTSRIRARKGLKVDLDAMPVAALHTIAIEVYEAGLDLLRFLGVHGIRLPQS